MFQLFLHNYKLVNIFSLLIRRMRLSSPFGDSFIYVEQHKTKMTTQIWINTLVWNQNAACLFATHIYTYIYIQNTLSSSSALSWHTRFTRIKCEGESNSNRVYSSSWNIFPLWPAIISSICFSHVFIWMVMLCNCAYVCVLMVWTFFWLRIPTLLWVWVTLNLFFGFYTVSLRRPFNNT